MNEEIHDKTCDGLAHEYRVKRHTTGPFVMCMNNDTTVTDIYEVFLIGIDTTLKRLDMTSKFAASLTINSNKTVCAKSVSKHVV